MDDEHNNPRTEIWGKVMGEEFAGKGANIQLGPGLNIARYIHMSITKISIPFLFFGMTIFRYPF